MSKYSVDGVLAIYFASLASASTCFHIARYPPRSHLRAFSLLPEIAEKLAPALRPVSSSTNSDGIFLCAAFVCKHTTETCN